MIDNDVVLQYLEKAYKCLLLLIKLPVGEHCADQTTFIYNPISKSALMDSLSVKAHEGAFFNEKMQVGVFSEYFTTLSNIASMSEHIPVSD